MRSIRSVRAAVHPALLLFAGVIITLFGGILIYFAPRNVYLGIGLFVIAGTASIVPSIPAPLWAIITSIIVALSTTVLFLFVVFVWHL